MSSGRSPIVLTRHLETQGKFVPTDREDLDGTVLDPRLRKAGVGIIELPESMLSVAGREVLWPEAGRMIEPAVDPRTYTDALKVDRILVPYIPEFDLLSTHMVMPELLKRADSILEVISMYTAGDVDISFLQTQVSRYQDQLLTELAGKYGLLSRNVLGGRVPNSGRFVIVPDITLGPTEIGIPGRVMYKAGIKDGDLVLVSRAPVLWQGSVLVQRAITVEGWAGGVNPYIMGLMGADFDGDTIAVMKIPSDSEDEALEGLDKTIKEHSKWEAEFLMWSSETDVDWTDPEGDLNSRLWPEGDMFCYTLAPEDVLNPAASDILQNMKETGCKKPPDDLMNYAIGMEEEEFIPVVETVVSQTIRMKVELGVIGSITNMVVQAVYALSPCFLKEVFIMKEKLTQALLDSKHGTDMFDVFEVSKILSRRGKWSYGDQGTLDRAIGYIGTYVGMEVATVILNELWPLEVGVRDIVMEYMPIYTLSKRVSRRDMLAMRNGAEDSSFMKRIAEVIEL